MFFAACGDETTQVVQDNMTIVATAKELPKCNKDNEGEEAFVKGETSPRICMDGKWFATSGGKDTVVVKDTVIVKDTVVIKERTSCTTKELKDKSGVKIVCGGDSVGVVLNGKNGTNGKDGATGAAGKDGKNGSGCSVVTLSDNSGLKVICGGDSVGVVLNGKQGTQGKQGEKGDAGTGCTLAQNTNKITITCGDKSSTINLNDIGTSVADTAVVDSEKVAVSLDSLAGYTQKGPFIKGSTVYLYELMDGRSLKQTNGSFTSNITRDDGRFKFTARDLVSQYVMLIVDGNYRNEVTGKTSNSAIRLKAYSDVRRHATGTVNVNILTHLEFDRVYYLVTREKMTMKNAKRQAQQEIRKQFYIEQSDNTDAENLDVFGTTDADAALLAISILLQGGHTEAELMALLTEISNDMAEDGKWNGADADSLKSEIALWALNHHGELNKFRENIISWHLSESVPKFEPFIDNFISNVLGGGKCEKVNEGKSITINKKYSPFNGMTFICKNGEYVEKTKEKTQFNSNIKYGEMIDPRDRKVYKTVDIGTQTWMAENLNYADTISYPELKKYSNCYKNDCEHYGRFYSWSVAIDSAARFSDKGKGCSNNYGQNTNYNIKEQCQYDYPLRGICPEGWHLPNVDEWYLLNTFIESPQDLLSKDADGTDKYGFSILPIGYYFPGESNPYNNAYFWDVPYSGHAGYGVHFGKDVFYSGYYSKEYFMPIRCLKDKEIEYEYFIDERDNHSYKTIKIGTQTWMAENLNYRPKTDGSSDSSSFCMNNEIEKCNKYGRFYTKESVQEACPKGWHIPDSTDWATVKANHGYSTNAMLTSTQYATNTLGLSLLPIGSYKEGMVEMDPNSSLYTWGFYAITSNNDESYKYNDKAHSYYYTSKNGAYTLRCVKDDK